MAATPTSLSTPVGGFVSSIVTVTPVNGFNAYVTLSCTGLPINTTCTFAPVNVPAACTTSAAGAQTCTPGHQRDADPDPDPFADKNARNSDAGMRRYAFVLPVLFGLAGLGARKRRTWRNLALGMLAFAGVMGMTACSERYKYLNHGPPPNPGTPDRQLHRHRSGVVHHRVRDHGPAGAAADNPGRHRCQVIQTPARWTSMGIAGVPGGRCRSTRVLRERKVRTPQGSVPDNVRDLSVKAQRRPVPQRTYRPGLHRLG